MKIKQRGQSAPTAKLRSASSEYFFIGEARRALAGEEYFSFHVKCDASPHDFFFFS
jgi:hypothetical protein